MLTNWLTDRPSRKAKRDYSFRPWLESLEERNAPSGPGGPPGPGPHGPPPPPGPHHPPPPPDHPPGVPLGVNNSISVSAGNGNHGSFNNSTITGSFNTTINNTTTVSVNLTMGQTTGVGGLLGISSFLSSALSNPQLGNLLSDEIALAVDHYLTSTPAIASVLGSTVVSDLNNDAATLTAAIAANPLESNPIGDAVGMLVFDLTSNALTSAQPAI